HILKGNSGTLGANRIFLAAQTLELSGRKGSLEEIPKQLNQLEEEIQSFKQYLNQATIFEL
ncbi:MAG TPA: response regulator, partial [Algoriphagus sp.]|nr:response regulator [Algoriphagus sp.]